MRLVQLTIGALLAALGVLALAAAVVDITPLGHLQFAGGFALAAIGGGVAIDPLQELLGAEVFA